jgi:hypothetical protein
MIDKSWQSIEKLGVLVVWCEFLTWRRLRENWEEERTGRNKNNFYIPTFFKGEKAAFEKRV